MLHALLAGLGAGLSLIVAIGAQNSFVLRQGLLRSRVGPVVAVCVGSDLALIAAGVAGLGALVTRVPVVLVVLTVLGAAFLLGYAALAVRRAVRGERLDPDGPDPAPRSTGAVIGTALALTWLNPHVYLDTVLLLGSVATGFGPGRWWFAAGAGLGSLVWFTALGYGARVLVPLFRRRTAWRVLDLAVAVIMITTAVRLLWSLR